MEYFVKVLWVLFIFSNDSLLFRDENREVAADLGSAVRGCTDPDYSGQCKTMANRLFIEIPFSEDSGESNLFSQAPGRSITSKRLSYCLRLFV